MGCNCLKNSASQVALANARKLENLTGEKYAIYRLGDVVYYGKLSGVEKMGVDYFTTDEVKHKPEPKSKKK